MGDRNPRKNKKKTKKWSNLMPIPKNHALLKKLDPNLNFSYLRWLNSCTFLLSYPCRQLLLLFSSHSCPLSEKMRKEPQNLICKSLFSPATIFSDRIANFSKFFENKKKPPKKSRCSQHWYLYIN